MKLSRRSLFGWLAGAVLSTVAAMYCPSVGRISLLRDQVLQWENWTCEYDAMRAARKNMVLHPPVCLGSAY